MGQNVALLLQATSEHTHFTFPEMDHCILNPAHTHNARTTMMDPAS